jgi:hypothetical protein
MSYSYYARQAESVQELISPPISAGCVAGFVLLAEYVYRGTPTVGASVSPRRTIIRFCAGESAGDCAGALVWLRPLDRGLDRRCLGCQDVARSGKARVTAAVRLVTCSRW